jgi:hypothetical protein
MHEIGDLALAMGQTANLQLADSALHAPSASYGGVEFYPLPEAVYTALSANPKMKPWKDKGFENIALSTRIVSKQGCSNICRQAF